MTVVLRRVLPLVVLAAAMAFLVAIQRVPEHGSDAYLHLRLGDEFRSGWSVGSPGHLSVYDTAEWYPTQWLSQMAMSWAESRGGLAAVVWLAGTLVLVLLTALYLLARRDAAPLAAAATTCLAVLAMGPGLSARPQVVSYVLIAVVVAAWRASARDLRPRYWLVPLTWVWAPLHGMWLVGVTIGVAVVVGLALEHRGRLRTLWRLALVPALSAVAALLTPVGLNVLDAVVGVDQRNTRLTEWGPPDFTQVNALFLLVMIAGVLLVALRSRRFDWPDVALLGLAIGWALYAERTTFVAAIILTPLLASALQGLMGDTESERTAELSGRTDKVVVVAMLLAASLGLAAVAGDRAREPVVAAWVDDRLEELPAGTRVLNDWELGHYVLWRHPQLDLVMHGYVDVFTVAELQRNIDILTVAPRWDVEVEGLDAEYAVVDPRSTLGYALVHTAGWEVVEDDDRVAVLRAPTSSGG